MMSQSTTTKLSIRVQKHLGTALSLLLIALFFIFSRPASHPAAALQLVQLALVLLVSGLLLLPPSRHIADQLISSLLSCVLLLVTGYLSGAWQIAFFPLLKLAMMIFLMSLLLASLRCVFSRSMLIAVFALLLGSPLWLSPLLDSNLLSTQWVNPLLALNPMTHLAISLDLDFLRQDWFYRHSVFGSLPFRYPDFGWVSFSYLLLLAVLQLMPKLIIFDHAPQGENH